LPRVLRLLERVPHTAFGRASAPYCVWLGSLGEAAAPAVPLLAALSRRDEPAASVALAPLGEIARPARGELAPGLQARARGGARAVADRRRSRAPSRAGT